MVPSYGADASSQSRYTTTMSIDGNLRALFHHHLRRGFHWQAVETPETGAGIPDSNFCSEGREGWIEFKKTSGWACPLREGQVAWIHRRVRSGGRVWIATRRSHTGGPRKGPPVDQLWLVPGRYVIQLRLEGLRSVEGQRDILITHGGPSMWYWGVVQQILQDRVA